MTACTARRSSGRDSRATPHLNQALQTIRPLGCPRGRWSFAISEPARTDGPGLPATSSASPAGGRCGLLTRTTIRVRTDEWHVAPGALSGRRVGPPAHRAGVGDVGAGAPARRRGVICRLARRASNDSMFVAQRHSALRAGAGRGELRSVHRASVQRRVGGRGGASAKRAGSGRNGDDDVHDLAVQAAHRVDDLHERHGAPPRAPCEEIIPEGQVACRRCDTCPGPSRSPAHAWDSSIRPRA